MRSRLLWALLLLAAVFSMHGLSCASAGEPAMPGGGPVEPALTALLPGHSVIASSSSAPDPVAGGHLTGAPTEGSTPENSPDHSTMHLLMVCLAVLAAGVGAALAAPAAWVSRRRPHSLVAENNRQLRTMVQTSADSLRAPDLSRLCLLRI